ncbi:MAG: hypothetical protein R2791_01750 [Saprospiraceae bacterium]|nr:hypothetical protein [Lewinellaceae bacterium]
MTRALLLLLFQPIFLLNAQQSSSLSAPTIDTRLYEVFDSSYLHTLRQDNPTLLLRWNYYLDHAFSICDFPAEKGDIAQLPSVEIDDLSRMNILMIERKQAIGRHWEKSVFYRINHSDKVLMYYPGKDFNRAFRRWLKS